MGLFKDLIKGILSYTDENPRSVLTEEDILKAIDELPVLPDFNTESLEVEEDEEKDDYNLVKVPKPKLWAKFMYLGKPEFRGMPNIDRDSRLYFTIPCGFEWDQSLKFWFITFPLNCNDEEVKDFFTVVDSIE